MTQLSQAKNGILTDVMVEAASKEPISQEQMLKGIGEGKIVIPKNINHDFSPYAVGEGTYIKVNANIGISSVKSSLEEELTKLDVAVKAGAHAVMDLSTCDDLGYLREIRKQIIERSPVMIGTVPVYEAVSKMISRKQPLIEMKEEDILEIIRSQAEGGVDFFTIHSGITREGIEKLKGDPRVCGIVSRGGSLIAEWMKHNNKENLFYTLYDEILDIAYQYDVTISLGDGMRPGAICDGTDRAQIYELIVLGELVDRAKAKGVQVMVEGPGHVNLADVAMNMRLMKQLCHDAPFYILGPLVTDVAPGYDHITSAIGGTLAGMSGADFLCYVTPAEHLHLPDVQDVHDGVIASKIAAHAADVALNKGNARQRDYAMSVARNDMDWEKMKELAIDPAKVDRAIKKYDLNSSKVCTMCGEFCSLKRDY